ncbi:MAG: hypothetical protein EZS28_006530 [Streblomastix strix]|uniref:SAP domain-containing protein n=1 Tax=Streblomastix strix TaxID=222440 RepID=A0A5J4WT02_9EUKA|nr:MAG: hypothetical protein EZS28_006530 [Streblomastix strix]
MALSKAQLQSILKVFNISTSGTVKQLRTRVTQLINELGFPKRGGRTNYTKVISYVVEKQIDQLQDEVIMEDLLKYQKQIIKATNFKETRQKIVRLQHFTQYEIDEIQEKIDLNQGKAIRHDENFDDFECLLFTEPQEHDDCKEEIERARQSYNTTSIVMQNDDVSTTYFDNKIITINDINGLIDTAYEDNRRRAFKMQFLFGTISEELSQGKYIYDHQPLLDSHIQQYAPAMITNQQTIDQYKLYIKSCIIEMQDFQITESTKYRYIGIYSMMVKVSRFPLAGLCMKELIDKHYKSHRMQLFYQVSELNDCFWLAYAKWILTGYDQKIKVYPNQIRCEAKKQICKFYHLTKKQYDTFIIEYKGFDVVEEMNKLIINDKINVNIFYYDNDDKFYYLRERRQFNKIKHIKTDDNTEAEEQQESELQPTFNILLVSDTHESQSIYHVFHVTNTDGLTRQKYCPHCYQQSFDPKDDHYKRDYDSHVSQCKINGGQIIRASLRSSLNN